MQGELGFDLGPYQVRDIVQFIQGKRESEWAHTSALLTVIASAASGKKKEINNPYAVREIPKLSKSIIKGINDD